MPRLLIRSGETGCEAIELRPGNNRLGRGSNNDFHLDHPTVSTAHCEIICQNGDILVRDCGSTNGTFINGQPIREALLKSGEALRLGDVEMVCEAAVATVAIPHLEFGEPPPPAPLPDGSVACLNHPEVRARRKCVQCQKCFCDPCVHTLRRVGGQVLKLCPWCSGVCELIPGKDEGKRRKRSIFASLWPFKKTLKMKRK